MSAQLYGRVFSRKQQFKSLPEGIQEQAKALAAYLTAQQADVFGLHHANLVKTVRSIRHKPLLEKIDAWIQTKDAPEESAAITETAPSAEETVAPAEEAVPPVEAVPAVDEAAAPAEVDAAAAAEAKAAEEAKAKAAKIAEEEALKAAKAAEEEAAAARRVLAKQLVEALVLDGFLTPYKEQEKLPSATAETEKETFQFGDRELFVPLAPEVSESKELTVWQVVDGAKFAGLLKRKAGFLAPLTQGKDVYAVVNERLKSLTLFETDVGRAPLVHFEVGETAVHVAFDKAHFVHGIKIWTDVATELVNAASKLEREALIHALVGVGFEYREDWTIDPEKIKSIYELKDVDIDGKEVPFSKYKGKVLLIVNVSSACGLTPINYPQLVSLDEKYRESGLEVLAFPCNQFLGQEPGTHEEIKAFVAQYNAQFQFFEKGDVNGSDARAVFAYLKAKQPGIGGQYIKWNFTKFLVDRDGQPVQRYAPQDAPLSFEGEIVKLLSTEPTPEAVAVETDAVVVEAEAATETKAPEPEVVEVKAPAVEPEVVAPVVGPEVKAEVAVAEVAAVVEAPEVVTPVVEEAPAPAPVPVASAAGEEQTTRASLEKKGPVTTEILTTEKTVEAATTTESVTVVSQQIVEESAAAVATKEEEPATPTKTEIEEPQVVQGFTPGNEPVTAAP